MRMVYVGFVDFKKAYNWVNMEALSQVLRMYDMGVKLLSRIKSMYVNNIFFIIVKGVRASVSEIRVM